MKLSASVSAMLFLISCDPKKKSGFNGSAAAVASPSPSPSPLPSVSPSPSVSPTPTPVAEVAVNYEDYGTTGGTPDMDYNDSVLCFKMKGAIVGTEVRSVEDQTITATLAHKSGCAHRIEIDVKSATTGASEPGYPYAYTSDTNYKKENNKTIQINFKKDSILKVRGANIINETDPNIPANCVDARKVNGSTGPLIWQEMSNAQRFQVTGNCNLSGG